MLVPDREAVFGLKFKPEQEAETGREAERKPMIRQSRAKGIFHTGSWM